MPQLIANALITAANLCLIGMGFGLICSTLRFFHFAHTSIITAAAYVLFLLHSMMGISFYLAAILSIIVSAVIGLSMEFCIYRRLRRLRAGSSVLLLASLGILLVLQNAISMTFGDVPVVIARYRTGQAFFVFGARITGLQIVTILSSAIATGLCSFWWLRSRSGITLRALADNPELAVAYGVSVNRIAVLVIGIGSILGGGGGILLGLDTSISPTMGFQPILMAAVVVLMAGRSRPLNIVIWSLFLGLLQHFVGSHLTTQWQNAVVFTILFIILLICPQRLFGDGATS